MPYLLKKIANRLDQGDVAQVTTLLPSTISKLNLNSVQLTVDFIFTLCTFYELTPSTLFLLVEEVISFYKLSIRSLYILKTFGWFKYW